MFTGNSDEVSSNDSDEEDDFYPEDFTDASQDVSRSWAIYENKPEEKSMLNKSGVVNKSGMSDDKN